MFFMLQYAKTTQLLIFKIKKNKLYKKKKKKIHQKTQKKFLKKFREDDLI